MMKKILTRLYLALTGAERKFFNAFSFLRHRPRARVFSVGNITTGGTGKTPVLFELIRELEDNSICVLTRGYRSPYENSYYLLHKEGPHPQQITDESLLLNKKFPDVPVFMGKNRHHSAIMAEKIMTPNIMLLDDGFQYRRLEKDVNILLWDSMAAKSEAKPLPFGRMREPAWRISDADYILLTRCESSTAEEQAFWHDWLRQYAKETKIIPLGTVCDGIFDAYDRPVSAPGKCFVFSAIGRPESFYAQIKSLGIEIVATREFRDHHRFSTEDLAALSQKAGDLPMICSEKDMIKIDQGFAFKHQILNLKIRVRPVSGLSFVQELGLLQASNG